MHVLHHLYPFLCQWTFRLFPCLGFPSKEQACFNFMTAVIICSDFSPWKESLTNLDSILKSRNIILLTKAPMVKAIVFPVVMHRCESWTIKKAECRRTDVFELWCWRTLWRVPWTARRSNQSILKKINPEYSLEGFAEAEARIL